MLSLESMEYGVTKYCGSALYHRYHSQTTLLRLQAHEGILMIRRARTGLAEQSLRLALMWLCCAYVRW